MKNLFYKVVTNAYVQIAVCLLMFLISAFSYFKGYEIHIGWLYTTIVWGISTAELIFLKCVWKD